MIEKKDFGKTGNGETTYLFTMTNANGMKVSITNFGGIITHLFVPDKNGKTDDVVLGFDSLDGYLGDVPYFGAIIGRYGNRIAEGKFELNGEEYNLAINNEPNNLHGGNEGFDKVIWNYKTIEDENKPGLKLTYLSKDGEEGFPGNLSVAVVYYLTNDNEIIIEYEAETDKPTVCNLTNHSYFNLKDGGKSKILDHILKINSGKITPVNENLIPGRSYLDVENTPFNFTEPKKIGADINSDHEQIIRAGGYDHNFALNGKENEMKFAAKVYEPVTGRILEVYTTEPGIQLYSSNFLDGSLKGKNNIVYDKRCAFCLETQHYPDSPNNPEFPSTVLNPGEKYRTTTIYKFSAAEY